MLTGTSIRMVVLPQGMQLIGARLRENSPLDAAQTIDDSRRVFTPIEPRAEARH